MDASALHQAISALDAARAAMDGGDADAAMRGLRQVPEQYLLGDPEAFGETVEVVLKAADHAGFEDLAEAARAVLAGPGDAHALYDYGFALTERGVSFLSVVPLALAVAAAPEAQPIRLELADALERQGRYAEAVTALAHQSVLDTWVGRYLLVYSSLFARDVDGARQWYRKLRRPENPDQEAMAARLGSMLDRVSALTAPPDEDSAWPAPEDPYAPLGALDLRGWYWVANNSVLLTLSPFGYDSTMHGRYAFYAESHEGVRRAVDRLAVALPALGRAVTSVAALPDRSSAVLAGVAAQVLGLPEQEWDPADADQLVVAWTLSDVGPEVVERLRRNPAQPVWEHATCWTDPPEVAADLSSLLHQVCTAPWTDRPVIPANGGDWSHAEGDVRPVAEIVADVLASDPAPRPDEEVPGDLPGLHALVALAGATAVGAPARTRRDRVFGPVPVPSARFW